MTEGFAADQSHWPDPGTETALRGGYFRAHVPEGKGDWGAHSACLEFDS